MQTPHQSLEKLKPLGLPFDITPRKPLAPGRLGDRPHTDEEFEDSGENPDLVLWRLAIVSFGPVGFVTLPLNQAY